MSTTAKLVCFLAMFGLIGLAAGPIANAQAPVMASAHYATHYAPQPTVANVPVRYGFFGRRLVMRPALVYPAPAVPVHATSCCAPVAAVAPTTAYYAPAPVYYSPLPIPTYWRP